MPDVHFTHHALSDLDRIFDFLSHKDLALSKTAGSEIVDATAVLRRHPMIGRPVLDTLRELVISKGRTGYVALYRFLPDEDRVDILAIRHQRECGFVE